jgi:hypothetical protein
LVLGLLVLLLVAAPVAQARKPQTPQPEPGQNGMDTVVGTIASPVHKEARPGGAPWEATFLLRADGVPGAAHIMVAFVASNPAVHPWLDTIQTASGKTLAPSPDQDHRRRGSSESKVFLDADQLLSGEEVTMRGWVEVEENGRNQVGALVIAFDEGWRKIVAPDGRYAQLYAYGFVGEHDLGTSSFGPPFQGQGNPVPFALVSLVVFVPAALIGGWIGFERWRQARSNS